MSELQFSDPYQLAKYIKDATKQTPVKAYISGDLSNISSDTVNIFGNVVIGDAQDVEAFLEANKDAIENYYLENDRRNSAVPMLDVTKVDARIEPGAFIRDQAIIQKNAVTLHQAVHIAYQIIAVFLSHNDFDLL